MKIAAMIAGVLGALAILFGLGEYVVRLIDVRLYSNMSMVTWPLRTILSGLPVVVLAAGIVLSKPPKS